MADFDAQRRMEQVIAEIAGEVNAFERLVGHS